MGFKQESIEESDSYRRKLYVIGEIMIHRLVRPWLIPDLIYWLLGHQSKFNNFLKSVHDYTAKIINKRRNDFLKQKEIIVDSNENM